MGQGKRMRRGSRHRVDLHDVMVTLFYSDASEEEIMAMSPRERHQAQQEGRRMREAPGYRSWGDESMVLYGVWGQDRSGKSWFGFLESIGRRDLGRNITVDDGFHCGRCGAAHDRPYCIPGEPKWMCKACAERSGKPAQAGRWKPRRGALEGGF
jgi:hypothetical protein